jgi:hypothetical protein
MTRDELIAARSLNSTRRNFKRPACHLSLGRFASSLSDNEAIVSGSAQGHLNPLVGLKSRSAIQRVSDVRDRSQGEISPTSHHLGHKRLALTQSPGEFRLRNSALFEHSGNSLGNFQNEFLAAKSTPSGSRFTLDQFVSGTHFRRATKPLKTFRAIPLPAGASNFPSPGGRERGLGRIL